MRMLKIFVGSVLISGIALAQAPAAKFDPKDLTGIYHRDTPFQNLQQRAGRCE